jgi:hypothetical protein
MSVASTSDSIGHSFQFYRHDSYAVDFDWEKEQAPQADSKFREQFDLKFENDVDQSGIVLRTA